MQRSGGPDIKVKYFDVPPLDVTADLRRSEPMRAVLEPEPGANWTDLFYELLQTTDGLVTRSHPVIEHSAIFSHRPSKKPTERASCSSSW